MPVEVDCLWTYSIGCLIRQSSRILIWMFLPPYLLDQHHANWITTQDGSFYWACGIQLSSDLWTGRLCMWIPAMKETCWHYTKSDYCAARSHSFPHIPYRNMAGWVVTVSDAVPVFCLLISGSTVPRWIREVCKFFRKTRSRKPVWWRLEVDQTWRALPKRWYLWLSGTLLRHVFTYLVWRKFESVWISGHRDPVVSWETQWRETCSSITYMQMIAEG